MSDGFGELFDGVMHLAQSQMQDVKTVKYGHISSYDPEKHAVKVIIPQDRTSDDKPFETEFIPLGAISVGNGWGIQIAPKGGATPDEPEKGEQVAVHIFQRNMGVMKAATLAFGTEMLPPGNGDEGEEPEEGAENKEGWDEDKKGKIKLKGGEFLLKHESGAFLKFYEDGNVQLFTQKDLHLYTKGDLNATVREGDLNVSVEEGDATVIVEEGDMNVGLPIGDLTAVLGLGDLTAELVAGNVAVTTEAGDIEASATAGSAVVSAGLDASINAGANASVVAAGVASIEAPEVYAGFDPATAQKLCNEAFMYAFNNHTHLAPGGSTSPPVEFAELGIHTTIALHGS